MPAPVAGLIPHLIISGSNASKAIDYYKKAFGATEVMRAPAEDGKRIMHAELKIGPASLYLCDDFPEFHGGKAVTPQAVGGQSIVIHQYVPDCDAAIKRAADAGGKVAMPASDQFWGDRYGQVTDPFGYLWSFGTPLKK